MDDSFEFVKHFSLLEDPRTGPAKRHELIDIVIVSICAVICGAQSWRDIAAWGVMRSRWLSNFLALSNGIPSHDTFARVFAVLDPEQFQQCFLSWIEAVSCITQGKLVAIDGKTLRRSFDQSMGQSALHLVSAWCSENHLVLGQLKVKDKSNEITAITKLLDLLDLRGKTITIDAMGCQKSIAAKIVQKNGDYVLGLKGNHPSLYEPVTLRFSGASHKTLDQRMGSSFEITEKAHGRIDVRRYWLCEAKDLFGEEAGNWVGLKAIGISDRISHQGDKESFERRYFALSFSRDVARFASAARGHWHIENELHWSMDVTFNEDQSRIRKNRAPENFAILRRIALSLTKRTKCYDQPSPDKAPKERIFSIRTKRLMAGWSEEFLLKILFGGSDGVSPAGGLAPGGTQAIETGAKMVNEIQKL
jgi:predicted transposase YbfD/YdcC